MKIFTICVMPSASPAVDGLGENQCVNILVYRQSNNTKPFKHAKDKAYSRLKHNRTLIHQKQFPLLCCQTGCYALALLVYPVAYTR